MWHSIIWFNLIWQLQLRRKPTLNQIRTITFSHEYPNWFAEYDRTGCLWSAGPCGPVGHVAMTIHEQWCIPVFPSFEATHGALNDICTIPINLDNCGVYETQIIYKLTPVMSIRSVRWNEAALSEETWKNITVLRLIVLEVFRNKCKVPVL